MASLVLVVVNGIGWRLYTEIGETFHSRTSFTARWYSAIARLLLRWGTFGGRRLWPQVAVWLAFTQC